VTRRSWFLVLGLAALALAAGVDAVLRGPTAAEPPPVAAEDSRELAPAFEQEGVSGSLFVLTRRGSVCELQVVELPSRDISTTTGLSVCRVEISPDGLYVAEARPCPGARSVIRSVLAETQSRSFVGCAPAWKPDGSFTYVRHGRLIGARRGCLAARGCERVLATREVLAGAFAPLVRRFGAATVTGHAWLGRGRAAFVVRAAAGGESGVVLDGLAGARAAPSRVGILDFVSVGGLRLRVSLPKRELIVGAPRHGFVVYDERGRFLSATRVPFTDVRAVAPSPDGRWLALARPRNVCIHTTRNGRIPVGCLGVDAVDVVWR
jgi:hypothetical protein